LGKGVNAMELNNDLSLQPPKQIIGLERR